MAMTDDYADPTNSELQEYEERRVFDEWSSQDTLTKSGRSVAASVCCSAPPLDFEQLVREHSGRSRRLSRTTPEGRVLEASP